MYILQTFNVFLVFLNAGYNYSRYNYIQLLQANVILIFKPLSRFGIQWTIPRDSRGAYKRVCFAHNTFFLSHGNFNVHIYHVDQQHGTTEAA